MRRRDFITLLSSTAVGWPLPGHTQQQDRMRRIGVNSGANDQPAQARHAAFLQGLQQLGWTEGRNVHIDTRWSAAMPLRFGDTRRNWSRLLPTSSSLPTPQLCWHCNR